MSIVNKYIKKPLSGMDILKLSDMGTKVEIYPNLIKYKNLDDLLGKNGACVILYMTKEKFGHWILLFKLDDNNVEFFNSYGGIPDDDLEKINKKFRDKSNQNFTYLIKLLLDSPYDIHYNQYQFQKKNNNIQTCGRWCIVRLLLRYLSIDEFHSLFEGLNGDKIVTIITLNLMP